jgi:hypothetical protein
MSDAKLEESVTGGKNEGLTRGVFVIDAVWGMWCRIMKRKKHSCRLAEIEIRVLDNEWVVVS